MTHKLFMTTLWELDNQVKFPESVAYDPKRDLLYVFEGVSQIWLESEEIQGPNGLYVEIGVLYVGCSGDGKGHFIISDYNGRVYRIALNGEKTLLLNTTTSGTPCADLEYIADINLIIIPTLYDNKLKAYRMAD